MNSPSSIHRQNLRRNTDSASLKQIQRYILYSKLQEAQNLRRESFTSSYVTSFHGRSPSAVGSVGTPFPEDELLLLSVDSVGRWRSSMRESSLASYRWSWKFGYGGEKEGGRVFLVLYTRMEWNWFVPSLPILPPPHQILIPR